ncbi:MAG: hypothetical protein NT069_33875 [Planctomycetota bacterium]|nr:hypothetical protein [Planctomycetota bacterium]
MNRPITRLSLADKIWNRLKGAYQSVIPRPKKGLSWTDSIPLVLFLALFAAVVVTLEMKHTRARAGGLLIVCASGAGRAVRDAACRAAFGQKQ